MSENSASGEFVERYHRRFARVRPKYAQLREMLSAALDEDLWREGDQVPTEHSLAAAVGCSVGTVQKAVHALVDAGRLTRTAGRGTFVRKSPTTLGAPFLSARFLDDSGKGLLPIEARVVGMAQVRDSGPWSTALRPEKGVATRLERVFNVNHEFHMVSRFYFDAARFPALLALAPDRLESTNLKMLFAHANRLPAIVQAQTLRFASFSRDICRQLRCRLGTTGLLQSVEGAIEVSDVVYFHEMYIPPNDRALQLPATIVRRDSA